MDHNAVPIFSAPSHAPCEIFKEQPFDVPAAVTPGKVEKLL
jgi:hypothetical protein